MGALCLSAGVAAAPPDAGDGDAADDRGDGLLRRPPPVGIAHALQPPDVLDLAVRLSLGRADLRDALSHHGCGVGPTAGEAALRHLAAPLLIGLDRYRQALAG